MYVNGKNLYLGFYHVNFILGKGVNEFFQQPFSKIFLLTRTTICYFV